MVKLISRLLFLAMILLGGCSNEKENIAGISLPDCSQPNDQIQVSFTVSNQGVYGLYLVALLPENADANYLHITQNEWFGKEYTDSWVAAKSIIIAPSIESEPRSVPIGSYRFCATYALGPFASSQLSSGPSFVCTAKYDIRRNCKAIVTPSQGKSRPFVSIPASTQLVGEFL